MSVVREFLQQNRTPLLLLLIGIPLIYAIATQKPKPQPEPPEIKKAPVVQVVYAEPKEWRLNVDSQGTVSPKREINLVAEISGRIIEVSPKFASGGFFEPGELLVKIDPRNYQHALTRSGAKVADARQILATEKGRARQAKREWRDLGNPEANALFLRQPQLASAEANLAAALADEKKAEQDLERTQITLPFAGRLEKTLVNLGQYVTPGTPIASAFDTAVAEVRLSLTERQTALIDLPFNSHDNNGHQPAVTLTGSSGGNIQQWQGRLTRTDASIDTRTRLYNAIAEINDPYAISKDRGPLLMGMFVEASIEGKAIEEVIQIPKSSLHQSNLIYTIDEQDQKITVHRVKVLHSNGQHAWIQAEIAPQTMIATEKQHFLKSGMTVSPMPQPAKTEIN